MIAVWLKPSASRAVRIAATWPSIIALGATMSAPARAWLTAISASRLSAASLSTLPSGASGPQWPWSVYSHMQVSAIATSGKSSARMRRNASWTIPSSADAPVPNASLVSGSPKSMIPPTPRSARRAASSAARSGDRRACPGIDPMGSRIPEPARTNSGATSIAGWRRVSRTRARRAGVLRRRRGRSCSRTWASSTTSTVRRVAASVAGVIGSPVAVRQAPGRSPPPGPGPRATALR